MIWLARYRSLRYVAIFLLISLPFVFIHVRNEVNFSYYLKSYGLLFSVYVFGVAFHQFVKICKSIPVLFKHLILLNLIFLAIALLALLIPALKDRFWYVTAVTSGMKSIPRLKMLTYEPSYYSILLVPIVTYYYLKMILLKMNNKVFFFLILAIPLLLSLSFGVVLGLLLTFIFLFLSDIKLFSLRQQFPLYLLLGSVGLLILFVITLQMFPNNVFFVRMANVFEGNDNSFRGRTFDSFYLGWKIAAEKSILFGSGPGQTKLLGLDFFKVFYDSQNFVESEIAIPDSVGDTLAVFGIVGVLIRVCVHTYFFFKTRVYANFYRLGLFIFVFIYQFTGSYLTNISEYVIWILAFSPALFSEFDKVNVYHSNS